MGQCGDLVPANPVPQQRSCVCWKMPRWSEGHGVGALNSIPGHSEKLSFLWVGCDTAGEPEY